MEISLYFTRHTNSSNIEKFMNQAGVTEWEVTDDGDLNAIMSGRYMDTGKTKGNPILYFTKNGNPLVVDECKCICYDTSSGKFYFGEPKLSQTAPYSIVTIGILAAICYVLYNFFR